MVDRAMHLFASSSAEEYLQLGTAASIIEIEPAESAAALAI
jgi:hypothetical protein